VEGLHQIDFRYLPRGLTMKLPKIIAFGKRNIKNLIPLILQLWAVS
jgi:hypothetical protein